MDSTRFLALFLLCCLFSIYQCFEEKNPADYKLVVVTIATSRTDGLERFLRSCRLYGIDARVYGGNTTWKGGDLTKGPGGGQKINILKDALKEFKDSKDTIVMFTDSYDVVFSGSSEEILTKFFKFDANMVISSEDFCWPDDSLKESYPVVKTGYRFLCSGGIIAYPSTFYDIVNFKPVQDKDDDQLYYTNIYLNNREKFGIKLDHQAEIVQNLNGNQDDVDLYPEGQDMRLTNTRFSTNPVVIHGNGPSKGFLDYLGNYLAKSWTPSDGCLSSKEDVFDMSEIPTESYPRVLLGLFLPHATPFAYEYLEYIAQLDYPKEKMDVYLYYADDFHANDTENWFIAHNKEYKSLKVVGPEVFHAQARNRAMKYCDVVKCDYYFSVDSEVSLTNPKTLRILMEQNRSVIAPKLSRHEKLWSNFWGALGEDGYYARSADYIDIVKDVKRGLWNVPYIASCYLLTAKAVSKLDRMSFSSKTFDPDMAFTQSVTQAGMFMYVTNMDYFGHLKEVDHFNPKHLNNDLYELFTNRLDWEDKYLHPEYAKHLDDSSLVKMPCHDVFVFPLMTTRYAKDMIEELEHFGQWSNGGHKDKRLSGGYENVPTVDIHMNQIGFEKHWLDILKSYVSPMATSLYEGHYPSSNAIMNFVVKYTPTGQYFLRPHHDSSTFTVNMALNRHNIDFEGGGSRFIRYNCSVSDAKVGWSLMHPGRLTHYHEGLPTTKGTRYIMVSFVDP